MNNSQVTVDDTIITASSTPLINNNNQHKHLSNFHEQPNQDDDSIPDNLPKSLPKTVEQSFETISRIKSSNSHQLSLSLKISIQEDHGNLILKNQEPKQINLVESLDCSVRSNDSDKTYIDTERNLLECHKYSPKTGSIDHDEITTSENDLPDIINNIACPDTQRYRKNTLAGPILDETKSLNVHKNSESIINPTYESEEFESNTSDKHDENLKKQCNIKKKESAIDQSARLISQESDKYHVDKNKVSQRDKYSIPNSMERTKEADSSSKTSRQTDSNSDQSNSDSGLGFSSSSHNLSDKPNNNSSLFSPSSESPNYSLISTSDGEQPENKEDILDNERNPISKNLKSLLKHGPKAKHNRRVTFDQTVIVFCEEFNPVLVINEHGDAYDPPSEYSDSSHAFEPPDDYRDDEDVASFDEEIDGKSYDDVFERNDPNMICCDLDLEAEQKLKNIIMNGASSFEEDQILGMLREDALLKAISMTVDELGEDDFPIHFNSLQSNPMDEQFSDVGSEINTSNQRTIQPQNRVHTEISDSEGERHQKTNNTEVVNERVRIDDNKVILPIIADESKPQKQQVIRRSPIADTVAQHNRLINLDEGISEESISHPDFEACHQIIARNLPIEPLKLCRPKETSPDNRAHVSGSRTESCPMRASPQDKSGPKTNYPELCHNLNENTPRQSVTIRQAIVEPMPLCKGLVSKDSDEPSNVMSDCKLCGNIASTNTISLATCQKQMYSQNTIIKTANPNPNATIIRIAPQPTSAQSNSALLGKIVNTNCPSLVNKQLHQIKILPRQTTDLKNACHLCRSMDNERISTNIPATQASIMNSQSQQSNCSNPQLADEKCINQVTMPHTMSKILVQNVLEKSHSANPTTNNTNQNVLAQSQASRPCCDLARKYQMTVSPANIGPGNELCSGPVARQIVYFVNQQGNTIARGSIPITKTHLVANQINMRNNLSQSTIYSSTGIATSIQGEHSSFRLPSGTNIYCNGANCSLLKGPDKILDGATSDHRCKSGNYSAPLDNHNVQGSYMQSSPQQNLHGGAPLYNARSHVDDKVGTTLRSGHTVYYIQHPLDKPPTPRYELDSNSNIKSHFPNANEIRRLDGLNAPPLTHNTSMIRSQKHGMPEGKELETFVIQDQRRLDKIRKKYSIAPNDESDDPSFGFSKRPAVKVITKSRSLKPTPKKNDDFNVSGDENLTDRSDLEIQATNHGYLRNHPQNYSQTLNHMMKREELKQTQNRPSTNRPLSLIDISSSKRPVNSTLLREDQAQFFKAELQVKNPGSAFSAAASSNQSKLIPSSSSQPAKIQMNTNAPTKGQLHPIEITSSTLLYNRGPKTFNKAHACNQPGKLIPSDNHDSTNKLVLIADSSEKKEYTTGNSNFFSANQERPKSNENVQSKGALEVAYVMNV